MNTIKERKEGGGGRPLRIHVCIDQELGVAKTSGLVRTWLRLLREAPRHEDLDLTLHAPATVSRVQTVASNARVCEHAVRYRVRPWLERHGVASPTSWLVNPFIPSLDRELAGADVIQTTSTHLAFSMAGLIAARRHSIPLVNALQTDMASYVEFDARVAARHAFRRGLLRRLAPRPDEFARRVRGALERQIEWYLRQCALVFVSTPEQTRHVSLTGPAAHAAYLPRGIDTKQFAPIHRDRRWLAHRYGIARDEPVVLFAGRIGAEKNPLLLAHALRRLAARDQRFTLIVCGNGPERAEVADLLPGRVVFAGFQPHETLRRIYASSDLFAFPSDTECFANVVVEAMSSGLPPLVSARGGACQHVTELDPASLMVSGNTPEAWANAIGGLLRDEPRRLQLGQRARNRILERYPTWETVMTDTVKPSWRSAAAMAIRVKERPQSLPRALGQRRALSGV